MFRVRKFCSAAKFAGFRPGWLRSVGRSARAASTGPSQRSMPRSRRSSAAMVGARSGVSSRSHTRNVAVSSRGQFTAPRRAARRSQSRPLPASSRSSAAARRRARARQPDRPAARGRALRALRDADEARQTPHQQIEDAIARALVGLGVRAAPRERSRRSPGKRAQDGRFRGKGAVKRQDRQSGLGGDRRHRQCRQPRSAIRCSAALTSRSVRCRPVPEAPAASLAIAPLQFASSRERAVAAATARSSRSGSPVRP